MSLTNIQMEQSLRRNKRAKTRTAPRFDGSTMLALKSISRVEGHKVKVINISRRGALVESRDRLSPGSTISLRLTTDKTVYFIKGRVVRSRKSPTSGRMYQSGISFYKDFEFLPAGDDKEAKPHDEALVQTVA